MSEKDESPQLRVVEIFFIQKTGNGVIWVQKRFCRINKVQRNVQIRIINFLIMYLVLSNTIRRFLKTFLEQFAKQNENRQNPDQCVINLQYVNTMVKLKSRSWPEKKDIHKNLTTQSSFTLLFLFFHPCLHFLQVFSTLRQKNVVLWL